MFVEVKDTNGIKHLMNMETIVDMAFVPGSVSISFNGLKDHFQISDADAKRLENSIRSNQ
jgi:hypothetical protein